MRKLQKIATAVASGLMASVGSVYAQSAPPVTATALAQSVDLSDAKTAGLVIVGLMVAVGVVLWGARLVQSKFQPKV